jgi:hypothetical protein
MNLKDLITPKVNYPTVIRGYVEGPLRLESLDGTEMYLEPQGELRNFQPVVIDGKTWAVTHLQKKSKRGWLLMSPYIYHWWNFSELQIPGKPGSEKGIYWRTPGWRWDNDPHMARPWVFSKGYFGWHLD